MKNTNEVMFFGLGLEISLLKQLWKKIESQDIFWIEKRMLMLKDDITLKLRMDIEDKLI